MTTLNRLLSLIRNGDPVAAESVNPALRQLLQNDQHLKALIDALQRGSRLVDADVSLHADTTVGSPVYWDSSAARYAPALAEVTADAATGRISWGPRAIVQGLVLEKTGSTVGTVLLAGVADVDLSLVISSFVEGPQYLSTATAGKLISTRPPAGRLICYAGALNPDGTRRVNMIPGLHELLQDHEHLVFELVCLPAGTHTPPDPDMPHVITAADSDQEGWLPADDAIFEGMAPAGAVFGYNLSASNLRNWWPPVPLSSAQLEWHRGPELIGSLALGQSVPTGTDGLVVIDSAGIWWMTDCRGQVPWPTFYDSEALPDSESADCDTPLPMRLRLGFSRQLFQTAVTSVLSLTADTNTGLAVVCDPSGEPGFSGNLRLVRDTSLVVDEDNDEPGDFALKRFSDEGIYFFGPIVSGLKISGPNVAVSSSQPADEAGVRRGLVTVTISDVPVGFEIPVSELRLDGVSTEFFDDVPTFSFAAGRISAIRGSLSIPGHVTFPEGAQLKLRFIVLARTTGVVPSDIFALTFRRIPLPADPLTVAALPLTDTALDLDAGVTITVARQYFMIESEAFDAAAGDQILFSLTRSVDAYAGNLHVLRQTAVLVLAEE